MTTTTWTFPTGFEGWTLRDDSAGSGAFSTLTYDAPNEALEQHAHIDNVPNSISRGWAISPPVGVLIVSGDTVAMDVSALTGSHSVNTTHRVRAVYDDETFQEQTLAGKTAATVTLTMTSTKILDHIELVAVEVGHGGFPTGVFDLFVSINEVRLTTANPVNLYLIRPLGLDLDVDGGSKIWVSYWRNGVQYLREYSGDFTIQNTFSFGSATESEIENRTFYLSPYAPGFFGTANLNDIIYVYGRWDDGAVTHLEKSTDGGSTFTDIGDSGTWGADWVGGFFADDANILYAFVNGGSPALYRSIDAGSNWTSLSSLPFDVDPGGVSKHPDGRILISNRDAGAQTAAYGETPDYSSWIDATGSPSFPVATPGNGSNAIIWIT